LNRPTFAIFIVVALTVHFAERAMPSDSIQELRSTAISLAQRGQVKESMDKIEAAIALAISTKQSSSTVDALQSKKIVLLFENKLDSKALSAVKEALLRKEQLIKSINQDPEIMINVDDILDNLLVNGEATDCLDTLKLGAKWCSSFPQFKPPDQAKVYKSIYQWQAKHGRWAEARACAEQAHMQLGKTDTEFLVRARWACLKQNKLADAARLMNELSKHTPNRPNTNGWYIHATTWMINGGDLESAAKLADKACATAGGTTVGLQGSDAIAESYSGRAKVELLQGKLAQAEADARIALRAAIGQAKGERASNLKLLQTILLREHKNTEAGRLHSQGELKELGL
jgi:tetratricopeptide (TPR) repeat protein